MYYFKQYITKNWLSRRNSYRHIFILFFCEDIDVLNFLFIDTCPNKKKIRKILIQFSSEIMSIYIFRYLYTFYYFLLVGILPSRHRLSKIRNHRYVLCVQRNTTSKILIALETLPTSVAFVSLL